MSEDTRINQLTDSGKYLFVYSDKHHVFLFFHRLQDQKLYRVTLDKYLHIEDIDEIDTPPDFFTYRDIKFFKPTQKNDEYLFTGVVTYCEEDGREASCRFTITRDHLDYEDPLEYQNNRLFNLLDCLKGIMVHSYIQKANKLYLVGSARVGEAFQDPVYAVVDIAKDEIEKIYYLYTDTGDITLSTINTDTDDFKVYVAGHVDILNKDEQVVDTKPYFESFTFDPS